MGSKVEKLKRAIEKLIPAMQKADEIVSEADDLMAKRDNLMKLAKAKDEKEREKAVKEILGVSSYFDEPIEAARKVRADLDAMDGTKLEWPEDEEGGTLFAAICDVVEKNGKDSKQAKAAWAGYGKHMSAVSSDITDAVTQLRNLKDQVPTRKKAAAALVDVSSKIEGVLEFLLKLPLPSEAQAALFGASQEAGTLRALAQVIEARLTSIGKKLDAAVKEGDSLAADAARKLALASKLSGKDVQELRKNARNMK